MAFVKVSYSTHSFIRKMVDNISTKTGVILNEKNKDMIETRISKYISDQGFESMDEYENYYSGHAESEEKNLISVLTTHHTYFFRETSHFDYIEKKITPILQEVQKRGDRTLKIWSAACSRGHEVYTLMMILDSLLKRMGSNIKIEITGSDVDHESVLFAKNGVYKKSELNEVPLIYQTTYLSKGTGDIADFVKMKSNIRDNCRFEVINLQKIPFFSDNRKFDIIFCRNVFIYFSLADIERITNAFYESLYPNGHLFIGISESLLSLKTSFIPCAPSVYQKAIKPVETKSRFGDSPAIPIDLIQKGKTPVAPTPAPSASAAQNSNLSPMPATTGLIRVLCVDDSSSILSLLKKILTPDQGFEVVDVALSGVEAEKKLKEKKFDIMTLDLHMPEKDGITYLKDNMKKDHPPVIIISSVRRDDKDMALKALELGVSDYVEKPALQNIHQVSEEIRNKIKCAYRNKHIDFTQQLSLEKQFSKEVNLVNRDRYIRSYFFNYGDLKQINSILNKSKNDQLTTFLFIKGVKEMLAEVGKKITDGGLSFPMVVDNLKDVLKGNSDDAIFLKNKKTIITDYEQSSEFFVDYFSTSPLSLNVSYAFLSDLNANDMKITSKIKKGHIILDDQLGNDKHYQKLLSEAKGKDIMVEYTPATSFFYQSKLYFKSKE